MEDQNTNIRSYKSYTLIFIAVVLLTLISTWLSQVNLGYLNVIIAVSLAAVSSLVVLTTFMNIKLNGSFFRLLAAGVLALALLIFFVAFVG